MPANLSMRDFAAETHLVVVLFAFQAVEVTYFPSHCISSSSLRSAEVLTDDELDQASTFQKIRNFSEDDGIKASHKKHPLL